MLPTVPWLEGIEGDDATRTKMEHLYLPFIGHQVHTKSDVGIEPIASSDQTIEYDVRFKPPIPEVRLRINY
jgi:hypothetical protein